MRFPPKDFEEHLIIAMIAREYGMTSLTLDFLPLGDGGWCYLGRDGQGARFFVKFTRKDRGCAFPAISWLRESMQFPVPRIIQTRSGDLYLGWNNCWIVIYEFLEGENLVAGYGPEEAWELGRSLACLHTLELPERISRTVSKETFVAAQAKGLDIRMQKMCCSHYPDQLSREVVDVLEENNGMIVRICRAAQLLGRRCAQLHCPLVLCHGDANPENVMRTQNGLALVDWGDLRLAAREIDVMRFIDERYFEEFWAGYRERIPDATLSTIIIKYYMCGRIMRELSDYVERVLFPEMEDEGRKLALQDLRALFSSGDLIDCLDGVM